MHQDIQHFPNTTNDELADIFFSLSSTAFNGTSVPGLGLTIARYNAGACSRNSINGESMVASRLGSPAAMGAASVVPCRSAATHRVE